MRKVIGVAVVVIAAGLSVVGCDPDKSGDPAIYNSIDGQSNCGVLQQMFDGYENGSWSKIANGVPDAKYIHTYMSYANDRMRDLGCYG